MFGNHRRTHPLTPTLIPDAGGESAFLLLPLAGEGWGEGCSIQLRRLLKFAAHQTEP
jgi:hypothetical protein